MIPGPNGALPNHFLDHDGRMIPEPMRPIVLSRPGKHKEWRFSFTSFALAVAYLFAFITIIAFML